MSWVGFKLLSTAAHSPLETKAKKLVNEEVEKCLCFYQYKDRMSHQKLSAKQFLAEICIRLASRGKDSHHTT